MTVCNTKKSTDRKIGGKLSFSLRHRRLCKFIYPVAHPDSYQVLLVLFMGRGLEKDVSSRKKEI